MPKVKADSDSGNKSNPYITKGISKALLTPCRRVGLSRKRKTPNSSASSLKSESSDSGNLAVTPSSLEIEPELFKTSESPKRTKKSVSKCLIVDDSDKLSSKGPTRGEESDLSDRKSQTGQDVNENMEKLQLFTQNDSFSAAKKVKNENRSSTKGEENTNISIKKHKENDSKKKVHKKRLPIEDDDSNSEHIPSSKSSTTSQESESINISLKESKKNDSKKKLYKKRLLIEDDGDSNNEDIPSSKSSTTSQESENINLSIKESKKNDSKKKLHKKRLLIEDDDDSNNEDIPSSKSSTTSQESINISIKESKDNGTKKVHKKRLLIIDDDDEDDFECLSSLKASFSEEKKPENKKKRLLNEDNVNSLTSVQALTKIEDEKASPDFKGFLKKEQIERKQESALTEIQVHNNIKKVEKKKPIILRRSLSLKKSSDDLQLKDCSVNLSTVKINSGISSHITKKDVDKLENEVITKRKILEDLKQAEIYKKLHNAENLNKLTETWKNGCITALNDLLPHLQAQAPTDLRSLLGTLGIPENLITLSESGDLI